jgi:hypothetical protein
MEVITNQEHLKAVGGGLIGSPDVRLLEAGQIGSANGGGGNASYGGGGGGGGNSGYACGVLASLAGGATGLVLGGACISISVYATGGTVAGLCPSGAVAIGAVLSANVTANCNTALGGNK